MHSDNFYFIFLKWQNDQLCSILENTDINYCQWAAHYSSGSLCSSFKCTIAFNCIKLSYLCDSLKSIRKTTTIYIYCEGSKAKKQRPMFKQSPGIIKMFAFLRWDLWAGSRNNSISTLNFSACCHWQLPDKFKLMNHFSLTCLQIHLLSSLP